MTTKPAGITTPYVFVSLYIMLGDADGSIIGTAVIPTAKWLKDIGKFKRHLAKHGRDYVAKDHDVFCEYHVRADAWTVKECTEDEARTLIKFCGKQTSGFDFPTSYID